MKKKPIVMMATTLIALLLLTPIVKAGVMHFWWDNVYYVDGTDIDYPHPDNVYYDISRNTDWTRLGNALYHCQINKDSTFQIVVGALAFSAFVGLVVTVWLGGGTMAALVGGVAGLALASFIQMVIDYYFVDERSCIWFWVSAAFVGWLMANLSWLGPLCQSNPAVGYSEILNGFLWYGYLRVGMVTFYNALGIPGPQIYSLTISVGSGNGTTTPLPETYECFEGISVTVTADAGSGYTFNYWLLDGTEKSGDSITVTMNSDHTLEAYFRYTGSNGGGGYGCPTLFVWDGSQYVEDALLDIHAETDITLQHTITETLVPDKNSYKLSLRELDNFTSHIDQVKLYVVDSDGEMHETHLTNAVHSELGDVKEPLLHDDDTRVDLTPEQTIDLRFTVPNIDEVAYFIFEINGYNMKDVGDGPGG